MVATAPKTQTNEVVQLLLSRDAYDQRTKSVELIETHISWVFLTDHFAYKLKKPVQLSFVDFSTLAARQHACEKEIRLNQRMSSQVYLSVLQVVRDARGRLRLGGTGEVVDAVVKMRRLPDSLALDRLVTECRLKPQYRNDLVENLTDFYSKLPPKVVRPQEHYRNLLDHCQLNQTELLELIDPALALKVRRIHGAQLRFLWLERETIQNRARDGRIVDGHGDLRAEHVFLESPLAVIDCLEFSDQLRQVDVADDLSFLAMDCARLGDPSIGEALFAAYESQSGDRPPSRLYDFFKSYRACVRAKVAALQREIGTAAQIKSRKRELHQYLQWADHYAALLGKPILVVLGGFMGTGKSTLAKALASTLGSEVISTDEVRYALLGPSQEPLGYDHGIYRPELRRRVYGELLNRAKQHLNNGCSVILDGAFLKNEVRLPVMQLSRQHGAVPIFIQCECPKSTAIQRLAERTAGNNGFSEARPDLFDRQVAEADTPNSSLPYVHVDTTESLCEELETVSRSLHDFTGLVG